MAIVNVKELLEAGVHFGSAASLWHPKMKPYLYGKRGNIHVIDIKQTVRGLIQAYYYAAKLGKANKVILFVGTKRQSKDVVRDAARSIGMPFVAERWLGGTLTNFDTVRASIRRLDDIEAQMSRPEYQRESKKVQSRHMRERRRVLRNLEGVRTMSKIPDAMFVVDPKKEMSAVREATRLNIPIIGLVDSDTDPLLVNLPIPGNDDGIRSIQAVVKVLLDGYQKGRSEQVTATQVTAHPTEAEAAATAAKAEKPTGAAGHFPTAKQA
jgi:small subunit ribosomal protein S2